MRYCRICAVDLVVGDNWTEGSARARSYLCRPCVADVSKKHYAVQRERFLERQRGKVKSAAAKAAEAENGRAYYEKNKHRWVEHRATRKAKEESDPFHRAGTLVTATRRRAAQLNVPFDLDREWMADRLLQPCAMTGLGFTLKPPPGQRYNPFGPSVERVDRSLGYTKTNCRLVVWIYKMARFEFLDEDVMTMAKALTERARQ